MKNKQFIIVTILVIIAFIAILLLLNKIENDIKNTEYVIVDKEILSNNYHFTLKNNNVISTYLVDTRYEYNLYNIGDKIKNIPKSYPISYPILMLLEILLIFGYCLYYLHSYNKISDLKNKER